LVDIDGGGSGGGGMMVLVLLEVTLVAEDCVERSASGGGEAGDASRTRSRALTLACGAMISVLKCVVVVGYIS
jgi:amino acid transporter